MFTFSSRLKEERERLGMTQAAFAAVGGVGKRSQINYECGQRVPDSDYLAALVAHGVDALYLLAGRREGSASVAGGVAAGPNASAPTHLPVGGTEVSAKAPAPALLMEAGGLYRAGGSSSAAVANAPVAAQPALPHDARRLAEAFAALPERTPQEADSRYQLYIDMMAIIAARCAAAASVSAPQPPHAPSAAPRRRTQTPP